MREVDMASLLSVTQQKSSDQVPTLSRGFHCILQTAVNSFWPPSPIVGNCPPYLPPPALETLAPEATSKPVSGRSSHSYAQYKAWNVTQAVRPVYSGQPRVTLKSTDQKTKVQLGSLQTSWWGFSLCWKDRS